ncbi:MAG: hypothetical protein WC809_02290 [Sinimarinibacterium sp.]|jgi:hypothetical protein
MRAIAQPRLLADHEARQRKLRSLLSAIAITTFLAVVAPAWLWSQLPDSGSLNLPAALGLAACTYCAIRLGELAYNGRPLLLASTFYAFVYVWGGISAFAQNYSSAFPWGVRHDDSHALAGMLQILLTLATYDAGRYLARRRVPPTQLRLRMDISHRAVLILSIAAVPAMLSGLLLLGGPDALFTSRGGFAEATRAAGSKMTRLVGVSLLRAPSFVAFVLVCAVCQRDWKKMSRGRKRIFAALLALTSASCFVGNYPLSLPRQWLGTIFLTPLFLLLPWRRWQVAGLGVGLIALVLFIFPYADAFRRQPDVTLAALETALKARVVNNVLYKGDFDVYQQTVNGIAVTETRGFSYGANFVAATLFWFPRWLWHDKPIGTGQDIAVRVGYPWHQTNLSAPLWSEGYWAFGWPGLALLMAFYGWISGVIDRTFVLSRVLRDYHAAVTTVVPFLAAYQFILLRGDILHGAAQATPVIVLFLVATKLRVLRPAAAREGGQHALIGQT